MSFDYVILILVIIGLFGGLCFLRIIKNHNYELNFKESLLYSILLLILTFIFLFDFKLLNINLDFRVCYVIVIYFLILLLIYYILRSIKHKKYIPYKVLIGYIIISVVNLIILFNLLNAGTSKINGWDALGLFIIYIAISITYIALLVLINFIIFIIKSIKKEETSFNNISYKISKFILVNLFITLLIIIGVLVINYFNELNYNKLVEKQREIVIDYLSKEYSNYSFEIIDTYETKVDCDFLVCRTPAFINEIRVKEYNKNFNIIVKRENLTIYEDRFKKILNNINR